MRSVGQCRPGRHGWRRFEGRPRTLRTRLAFGGLVPPACRLCGSTCPPHLSCVAQLLAPCGYPHERVLRPKCRCHRDRGARVLARDLRFTALVHDFGVGDGPVPCSHICASVTREHAVPAVRRHSGAAATCPADECTSAVAPEEWSFRPAPRSWYGDACIASSFALMTRGSRLCRGSSASRSVGIGTISRSRRKVGNLGSACVSTKSDSSGISGNGTSLARVPTRARP